MILPIVFLAAFSNALQIALMAEYYRKLDTLSAVAYRGLSLVFTMWPLLLFVPFGEINITSTFFIYIASATCFAVIANWTNAISMRYLSVPVSTALGMGFWSVIIAVLAYFFEDETLKLLQIFFISLTLITASILGITQNSENHLMYNNRKKGVLLTLLFGFAIASAGLFVGKASREFHPFITGYTWEVCIGVTSACIAAGRSLFTSQKLVKISLRDFSRIMLFSAPTTLGTGLFAYSVTQGKLAVMSAIFITATMIFSSVLAYFRYKEKLNTKQLLLLGLLISFIVALKLVSE